jgi:hypothetical protein
MGTQLTAINNFCEDGFKNGKIIPLSFEFPSFQINEIMFKETAKDVVNDKVRLGIETGKYGHPLMENLSYEDLVEAQKARLENRATKIQEGQTIFAEKILPVQMKKDENLDYSEINRKTLAELCESRLKYSFANIEASSGVYSDEYSKAMVQKDKFTATMIMMKDMIPNAHRQISLSLKNHPNQHLVSELKSMEDHPSIAVVRHILDIDPKFAEKYFPKETKTLVDGDNIMAEFKASKIKFG